MSDIHRTGLILWGSEFFYLKVVQQNDPALEGEGGDAGPGAAWPGKCIFPGPHSPRPGPGRHAVSAVPPSSHTRRRSRCCSNLHTAEPGHRCSPGSRPEGNGKTAEAISPPAGAPSPPGSLYAAFILVTAGSC